MILQNAVLKGFERIFQHHSVISVSGESGTGKTSLALFLVSQSLDFKNSCFWIQASEQFPRRRLVSMYKDNNEKCNYLLDNIYITPNNVLQSYSKQVTLLEKMGNENFIFPPDLNPKSL